jgi:hypothetical protein
MFFSSEFWWRDKQVNARCLSSRDLKSSMFYKVIPVLRTLADTGIPRDLHLYHTKHNSSLNMLQQRHGTELGQGDVLTSGWLAFGCCSLRHKDGSTQQKKKTYRNSYVDFKLALNKVSYFVNTSTNKYTRWRSWLRHCATRQEVAVSIPDGVTVTFHWHNPYWCTVARGST